MLPVVMYRKPLFVNDIHFPFDRIHVRVKSQTLFTTLSMTVATPHPSLLPPPQLLCPHCHFTIMKTPLRAATLTIRGMWRRRLKRTATKEMLCFSWYRMGLRGQESWSGHFSFMVFTHVTP